MTIETITKLYHKYYLFSIYDLINKFNCSYQFESLNDNVFLNHSGLKYQNFDINNSYLQLYKNDKIKLAEDILANGMFFPFFGYKQDKDIYIILGKHRLYSLLLKNKQNKIDNKFLFIYFDHDILLHSQDLEQKQQVLLFDRHPISLIRRWVDSYYLVFRAIDNMGDNLSREIFNCNAETSNSIAPSAIINNEELFKQFIESPLDENNIMFECYKELKKANE